jgi:hypothetical protein
MLAISSFFAVFNGPVRAPGSQSAFLAHGKCLFARLWFIAQKGSNFKQVLKQRLAPFREPVQRFAEPGKRDFCGQ